MSQNKYLASFPEPLLSDMVSGRWLPFIGAGFSRNAKTKNNKKLPLWDEMGQILGRELQGYKFTGSIDAISHYEHEFGRPRLIERMTDLLMVDASEPDKAHHGFCDLPFDIVCTTNFDFLLEKKYAELFRYCKPITDEDNLSINLESKSVLLLKIHGDLHHPNRMVMTESDYDSFISKNPLMSTYIASLLINRTAVFIGYSLEDYDFRQIWQIIGDRLGKSRRMAYVIAVGMTEIDIARYSRRGVRVINLPGSPKNYNEILHDTFTELRDYWNRKQIENSRYADINQTAELLSGSKIANRVCYFAIPYSSLSFYKEYVYSVVTEFGYVPIFESDMFSPGDSFIAKIDALVASASLIISEPYSNRDINEINYLANIKSKKNTNSTPLIIIGSEDLDYLIQREDRARIRLDKPKLDSWTAIQRFQAALREALEYLVPDFRQTLMTEPGTLLAAGFYNQAIASAFTALEYFIESWLKLKGIEISSPSSINRMFDMLFRYGQFEDELKKDINSWQKTRNLVLHGRKRSNEKEARETVNGIIKFINDYLL